MSAATQPINPERFRAALHDLPLDSLHAKVAELRNSISRLKGSNEQMLPFAEEGDQDCKDAMFENLGVIGRMNERIQILREEVQARGMRWSEAEEEEALQRQRQNQADASLAMTNGDVEHVNGAATSDHAEAEQTRASQPSGRLTDEELRRRLEAQMAEDDDEEGVHL